jgi:uncharacterized protein (TIGR02001 family)
LCFGILLWALPATARPADLTASVAALSDFRFRGVSLSDREPALQAGVDWSHPNGAIAGALLSTVNPGPAGETRRGVAGLGYLGWSGAWTEAVKWSGGVALYAFPRQPEVGSLNYRELFLRAGTEDLQFGLYGSNSYFDSGAPSVYVSVAAGHDVGERLRLFMHVGWLWTGSAEPDYFFYDRAQRFDLHLGTHFDLRWASVELSLVGTTNHDNWCRADHRVCELGPVLEFRAQF